MATTWGHFVVKCEIFHIYAEKKEKKLFLSDFMKYGTCAAILS